MPRALSEPQISQFRERLCDAARRVFARHGAAGLTMRALAAELGVSPMTPYRYFPDKDAILAAVRARAFDRFAEVLEAGFEKPGSAEERGRGVADAYVRFAFAEPDSYRLMFDLAQPGEADYPELVRASTRARKMMTAHVRAMVDEGRLEGDPGVIGHVFWAALHGAVVLELAGKLGAECDFDRLREASLAALARGFSASH